MKLKFHERTLCILRSQKFSFKLPMALKTDFERRNDAF